MDCTLARHPNGAAAAAADAPGALGNEDQGLRAPTQAAAAPGGPQTGPSSIAPPLGRFGRLAATRVVFLVALGGCNAPPLLHRLPRG